MKPFGTTVKKDVREEVEASEKYSSMKREKGNSKIVDKSLWGP